MELNIVEAARLLAEAEDIVLIAHKSPDGDTLGSCFALYYALQGMGKRVRVECSDPFPPKYGYFLDAASFPAFEPRFVAAVDVADRKLFGKGTERYARIDLCIDHHPTNTGYAEKRLVDPAQAATAQLIYKLLRQLEVPVTPRIADCLFTGISTDTGCFRYSSVTAETHRIAAELITLGADAAEINRLMFETKTRARLEVERMALESLSYAFGGRCAMIHISQEVLESSGASEDELEGVSSIPRQIEGVWAGITFNRREEGYKISVRTDMHLDASRICAQAGGGGHLRAGGCFIEGDFEQARARMLDALAPLIAEAEARTEGFQKHAEN